VIASPAVFRHRPLIAILRGLTVKDARDVGRCLITAGFDKLEVPQNTPGAFEALRCLIDTCGDQALVGAGTIVRVADVEKVAHIGARYIVSPNTNANVISATKRLGLLSVPGVLSPSEALAAIDAGADALKFFPAQAISPESLKATASILPGEVPLFLVGGIEAVDMNTYRQAGATGFGLGNALYQPGKTLRDIEESAYQYLDAIHA